MVIGDRHTTGGLTTTKPQNPTKTQAHRTNENPIHRNTIKEQLGFQLRQECKARLRAHRRVCTQQTTLERRESKREADLFKPVVDGFLVYLPVSYFTKDPDNPVLYLNEFY
jgi:hypothetical protein